MNIAEASTSLSQVQVQQEAGTRVLRMAMDNAEMQAEGVNRMTQAAPQAAEQLLQQQSQVIGQAVQEEHLGNIIDLHA